MTNMPWKEAIEHVLREHGEAMHYTDIASRVEELGLRKSLGATPAASVSTALTLSIRNDSTNTPFYRASTGYYGLRSQQQQATPTVSDTADATDVDTEPDTNVLKALGMFWLRSNVLWKNNPAILGRQQVGSDPVDLLRTTGNIPTP